MLPPDPWFEGLGNFADDPILKHIFEGSKLATAFLDVASMSGLVERLRGADRRDIELVALFTLSSIVRESLHEHSRQAGEDEHEANARVLRWLTGPATQDPLDEPDAP